MRYCKQFFFCGLIMLPLSLWANEEQNNAEAINDITGNTEQILKNKDPKEFEDILKAKDEARKLVESGRLDWLKGESQAIKKEALVKEAAKNSFINKAFSSEDMEQASQSKPKYPDDAVYVFVSLSMPKSALKSLFSQAVHQKEKKIFFITRGWKQHEFTQTISAFARLWPSVRDRSLMPLMMTDPNLYRSLNIDAVPAYAYRKSNGEWVTLFGGTDIDFAIESIEGGTPNREKVGSVFEIKEPDLIAEIQKAAEKYDWSQDVEAIKKKVFSDRQMASLPDATEDKSYLIDMSIQVNKPITANGKVYADAGQRVNPLSFVTVTGSYAFADITKESHLKVLREWKQSHPLMKVVAVKYPEEETARIQLNDEFGGVGLMNNLMVKRFKLMGLPSIAKQEGMMMKITMKKAEQ